MAALHPSEEVAEVDGATGETACGTTLSTATLRAVLCDATVRRLVVDPVGIPIDVGRATRTWSASQRPAIAAVDGGCRAPGSDLPPDRCVVHHIRWWERDEGPTESRTV